MLLKANKKHEETAFYSIAGDMVSTGLYRSEWDELFGYSKDVFSYKPLMPVLGNHDRQDGLGSWMYYELFALCPAVQRPASRRRDKYERIVKH